MLVPYLMAIGVLAGVVLGYLFSSSRIDSLYSIDEINCSRAFPEAEPPADCPRVARECRHSDLDLKEVDFPGGAPTAAWPKELRPPSRPESRARVLCIYRKTR